MKNIFIIFLLSIGLLKNAFALDSNKPVWDQVDNLVCVLNYYNICQNKNCDTEEFEDEKMAKMLKINFIDNIVEEYFLNTETNNSAKTPTEFEILHKKYVVGDISETSVLLIKRGGSKDQKPTMFNIIPYATGWKLDTVSSNWNNDKNHTFHHNYSCQKE